MPYVIGIDLGTTNSVVAYLENGKPQVMQNAEGSQTTPSVIHYPSEGDPIVGDLAKRQRMLSPERTLYSIKRFVGCRWAEAEERRKGIEYPLVEGPDGLVATCIDERVLLPESVQAEVLRKMKQTAEDYLGETITEAVITCPAYFNDSQRQATKKAAELAGLDALRIINEPTAAALAYGLLKHQNQKIAVFDFGGGTFDISILDIDEDVFEVKATCGDTWLGGDSIDDLLSEWVLERIREEQGLDLSSDPQALSRISEAAEKLKCELSTLETTTISLPFIGADETGPKHFQAEMTRAKYEEMIAPILARLQAPCLQALSDAGVKPEQLGAVLLVGGSTRIPAVHRLVKEIFGREPDRSVSPDNAVALGAAIQAGIMNGALDEILLLDVTPLSLGIELAGGLFSPLITRNSSIPTTAKKKFTTVRDNQTSVHVHVLQGERNKALENRTLARFVLEGIAPAPREVTEVEVSFNIDANGILNVMAMDLTTGSLKEVRVESYQPTIDGETERMISDAVAKADEDRSFKRKVMVKRHMDEMNQELVNIQKEQDGPAFTEEQERRFKEAVFHLDMALTSDDWAMIGTAERKLKSVFNQILVFSGHGTVAVEDELIFDIDEPAEKKFPDDQKPPMAKTDPTIHADPVSIPSGGDTSV